MGARKQKVLGELGVVEVRHSTHVRIGESWCRSQYVAEERRWKMQRQARGLLVIEYVHRQMVRPCSAAALQMTLGHRDTVQQLVEALAHGGVQRHRHLGRVVSSARRSNDSNAHRRPFNQMGGIAQYWKFVQLHR